MNKRETKLWAEMVATARAERDAATAGLLDVRARLAAMRAVLAEATAVVDALREQGMPTADLHDRAEAWRATATRALADGEDR